MSDKMRVHILAKQLNVTSKAILAKCTAEGLSVKNHMSTLTAGQEATLREWFSEGIHDTTVEVADRVNLEKVRVPRRKRKAKKADVPAPTVEKEAAAVVEEVERVAPDAAREAEVAAEETPVAVAVAETPVVEAVAEAPAIEEAPAEPVVVEAPASGEDVSAPVTPLDEPTLTEAVGEAPETPTADAAETIEAKPEVEEPTAPAGPQNVPKPARLRGPRVVRYEAPELSFYEPGRGRRGRPSDVPEPGTGKLVADESVGVGRGRGRRGEVPGKGAPRSRGSWRRGGRGSDAGEMIKEWRDRDLIERRERLAGATGRRIHTRRFELKQAKAEVAPAERKTSAEIQEPFSLKDFCAAIGVPFLSVFNVLKREHGMVCNVNSFIGKEVAELVAMEFGIELTVIEAKTSLDILKEEFEQRERRDLQPRPPVITFLGHVDHGKTSLLDAIRRANVVAGEDGGITQHLGSYHVQTPVGPLTFLDTPGHEAFTAMRARGARMTDIVVLVVAADDGVMPQTIEAINHARAADVALVVALNKIDLGTHKEVEIFGQLAANGLTPSGEWGGDIDVVRTSAVDGSGIDELLEHLAAMGEVMELKADPSVDATGTVIEARTKEGVGPVVRVLVQEGTLRKGDVVICGNAAGKIRGMRDDRGQLLESAGPSIPVEIWGLEDVPMAGDRLFQVDSMHRAKQIAGEVAHRRTEDARTESRKARSLEDLFRQRDADEVPELNVIIKADVDGSVDVLRYSLSELPSDKVRLSIRHAGVGAVNDSDVVLADASDAIIIAFRATTQTGAKKLAEASRVDIRYYRVVYEVVDEIIKAMESKLAPEQKQEPRGTAEVRQIFKVSKVGWVAGCMVTDGIVSRNHLARIVREGVVVREDCRIDSLRHFKEDVKEVRAGMECGIRLEGFDDVKPGDVLEIYEIIQVARTL
ncbi:MAG: translation initiation factor IF-2 [Phycisphaerales bacterium]|nr:MAG: translation initiation factor IF-2 [Phycisphaerales bacterium]